MKRNAAVSALRLLLPLLFLTGTVSAQNSVPEYKTRIIRNVLNDLSRSINRTKPSPQVVVDAGNDSIAAFYEPNSNVISIGERFYDLCRTFGPDSLNALAAVLAHELGHWERNHFYDASPKSEREENIFRRNIPGCVQHEERQADYLAGFYGQQAGYDPLKIFPEVLDMIYRKYELDDVMEGYPSLAERKEIALNARERMEVLGLIYELANNLSLIGKYSWARQCYDVLMEEFQSREIMNNAGVVRALQALELMNDEYAGYICPLMLDAGTRLNRAEITQQKLCRITRDAAPPDDMEGAWMLDSAVAWFNLAMAVDPDYAPAQINRAAIHILKGEYEKAGALPERMPGPDAAWSLSEGAETIDGIRAADDVSTMRFHAKEEIGEGKMITSRILDNASLIRMSSGKSWVQFVGTDSNYPGLSRRGISIGCTAGQVLSSYGQYPRIVHAVQGRYYIYNDPDIIFLIGDDGKVLRWMIYAMGE